MQLVVRNPFNIYSADSKPLQICDDSSTNALKAQELCLFGGETQQAPMAEPLKYNGKIFQNLNILFGIFGHWPLGGSAAPCRKPRRMAVCSPTLLSWAVKCGKICKTKNYLQTHMRQVHADKVPCDKCGKLYKDKVQLRKHVEIVHEHMLPKASKCTKCELVFAQALCT